MTYTKTKEEALTRLTFRASDHRYTLDGMVIPSVTQVLDVISAFAGVPDHLMADARLRGTLVHKLTEVADRGEPWEDDARETVLFEYIEAWEMFKRDCRVVLIESEQRVFHTKYRYSGTFDRIVEMDGKKYILDIKTGEVHPEYAVQTAAYVYAYNEGRPVKEHLKERLCVVLKPNGRYHAESFDVRELASDFQTFTAALTITSWRLRNGYQ